jgi:hypothetical protein
MLKPQEVELLYECSYGFINGEAGGSATDGKMRILIKS